MKKCPVCNREHGETFGSGKFCSRSCANSRKVIVETKIVCCTSCGKEIEINKRASKENVLCKECKPDKVKKIKKTKNCSWCGAIKGSCIKPHVCKKHQIIPTLIKYFGFKKETIGTEQVYVEFDRVKALLIQDYIIKQLSTVEIQKKYNCLNQRVVKVFKNFEIPIRTLSEACKLAHKNGKIDCNKLVTSLKIRTNSCYKSGWHTTWSGEQVFLRSSYELDYAKQLDKEKIEYEVESLRIPYWDSNLLKQRLAIPDFYLLETNTIVEIKSLYTYDSQNMRDRVKAFLENNYNFKLILNKKEVLYSDF
jgi:hypothetical protein